MVRILLCLFLALPALVSAQVEFIAPNPILDYINGENPQSDIISPSPGIWLIAYGLSPYRPDAYASTGADIAVLRSTDEGLTWNPVTILDASLPNDQAWDAAPTMASDQAGNVIIVWDADGGIAGVLSDVAYSTSPDAGATWSAPRTIDPDALSNLHSIQYPYIATDSEGTWMCIFWKADPSDGDFDIYSTTTLDNGLTWSSISTVNAYANSDIRFDEFPHVATDGSGHWVAVWSSALPGGDFDILAIHSVDSGQTWTGQVALTLDSSSVNASDDSGAKVFYVGDGEWIVTWGTAPRDSADSGIRRARSTDGGATWSAPEHLPLSPFNSIFAGMTAPRIAIGSAGRWAAVWEAWQTGFFDMKVYYSHSTDAGETWLPPQRMDPEATIHHGGVKLVSDGDERWIATWVSGGDPLGSMGTAYAAIGRIYSEQPSNVGNVSSSGSGSCFIATAAYGSPLEEKLYSLRTVRDQWMRAAVGVAFVDTYYRLSPPIAEWISVRPLARSVARMALVPLIWASVPLWGSMVLLTVGVLISTLLLQRRKPLLRSHRGLSR